MSKEPQVRQGIKYCKSCVCWFKVSPADGGIGVCDCLPSDHNQHVIGWGHPACVEFIEVSEDVENEED